VRPNAIRFGLFEADLSARELRKRGRKIPLQDQPFRVLTLLLQRAGELVSREEFQRALWPGDTFVEFDEGLNKAIQKLRQALDDSSDNPRFIETSQGLSFHCSGGQQRNKRSCCRTSETAKHGSSRVGIRWSCLGLAPCSSRRLLSCPSPGLSTSAENSSSDELSRPTDYSRFLS
jgi:DNA-binding winged helix-turn-helix (wHTH) protein